MKQCEFNNALDLLKFIADWITTIKFKPKYDLVFLGIIKKAWKVLELENNKEIFVIVAKEDIYFYNETQYDIYKDDKTFESRRGNEFILAHIIKNNDKYTFSY